MRAVLFSVSLLGTLACVSPASAKIEEVRLGVVGNIRSDRGDIVRGKYEYANVEIDLVSNAPDFLNVIGSPRPYLMASIATESHGVSFGGVGVYWRWEFADGWAFEPGFGYIIHDGEIDNIYTPGTPEAAAFVAHNQLLGSRDLFRTSFAMEREFGDRFAGQLYWQHMSHGQILGSGRNQGLDYVGVRFLYRLSADPAN
ncbi:MAG: acyloxyacyl hydrolase [Hyphomonadaceae bacterium]|nr:acyloxyacyl hydrolase [Hyphomonadaceae bacterium]